MPVLGTILLIQLGIWFVFLFEDGFTSKIKAVLPFLIVAGMKIGNIK